MLQVSELAEWALAAIPAAQRAQHAQHAAPHVLALLTAAIGALARTREAVLGDALRVSPQLSREEHSENNQTSSRDNSNPGNPLWSDDLSAHVVSVTLEHVVAAILFPEAGGQAAEVRPCECTLVLQLFHLKRLSQYPKHTARTWPA